METKIIKIKKQMDLILSEIQNKTTIKLFNNNSIKNRLEIIESLIKELKHEKNVRH